MGVMDAVSPLPVAALFRPSLRIWSFLGVVCEGFVVLGGSARRGPRGTVDFPGAAVPGVAVLGFVVPVEVRVGVDCVVCPVVLPPTGPPKLVLPPTALAGFLTLPTVLPPPPTLELPTRLPPAREVLPLGMLVVLRLLILLAAPPLGANSPGLLFSSLPSLLP